MNERVMFHAFRTLPSKKSLSSSLGIITMQVGTIQSFLALLPTRPCSLCVLASMSLLRPSPARVPAVSGGYDVDKRPAHLVAVGMEQVGILLEEFRVLLRLSLSPLRLRPRKREVYIIYSVVAEVYRHSLAERDDVRRQRCLRSIGSRRRRGGGRRSRSGGRGGDGRRSLFPRLALVVPGVCDSPTFTISIGAAVRV